MYRQGIEEIELWIEQDTARTPEPNRFYIFRGLRPVGSFATLRSAVSRYRQLLAESDYKAPGRQQVDAREAVVKEAQDDIVLQAELRWADYRFHRSDYK
jgi:hypothetical protein